MSISMFVKKGNKLQIDVFVYETEEGVEATTEKQEVPQNVTAEVVSFTFRRPNYADSNALLRQFQGMTGGTVDVGSLQNLAMSTMLVDWSLTDEKGEKVSVNKTNIDALQPAIGRAAAMGYLGKIKF